MDDGSGKTGTGEDSPELNKESSSAAEEGPFWTRFVPGLRSARRHRSKWIAGIVILAHSLGVIHSVQAVMASRTSQGAIAWAVSLNTMPYVAVPAYWIFGRSEFNGYVLTRMADLAEVESIREDLRKQFAKISVPEEEKDSLIHFYEQLTSLPFSRGNEVELLIDGEATFDSIFRAIEEAEDYVLIQFYIVRGDGLGNRLRELLERKAKEGVRVYFLYDEIGSYQLSPGYLQSLRSAGVKVSAFHSTRGVANRFQINFRNHRKIVVVDGDVGFVGGHNVGDEYLGLDPKMSPWRDTHARVAGPAVTMIQVPFVEDWHWATDELILDLDWVIEAEDVPGDAAAGCLPTGPADGVETCAMFFLEAIHSARERLWIASPYFVPDEQTVTALQMAAIRGVDVRVLIPENPDSNLVYWSSFSYLPETEKAGVKIYRYQPGFLHQKVLLVDDEIAAVGTANFDNRSFRLNFEVTLVVKDKTFNEDVAAMLEEDFSRSRLTSAADMTERNFFFRLRSHIARLMAPVQ